MTRHCWLSGTLEIVYSELGAEIRGARHDEEHLGILPVPDELCGDADRSNLSALMFEDSISTRQFIDAIAENRIAAPTSYDGMRKSGNAHTVLCKSI